MPIFNETLRMNKLLLVILFLLVGSIAYCQDNDGNEPEVTCGVQRWSVKVMTDPDTTLINFNNIVPSTISEQKSFPAPTNINSDPPRLSNETTVYQIDCYLIFFKSETDQDIHCGIMSLNMQDTMVAEICDYTCPGIANTSRYQKLKTLRDWFVSTYHPSGSFQTTFVKIRLTGVGFFDSLHGQRGMARNGREIHSILSMSLLTEVNANNQVIPASYSLGQNFPNPFNPSTRITFNLPVKSFVNLKIYDNLGKEVFTLVNDVKEASSYTVDYSAINLPSGVYYYSLKTDNFSQTRKMTLMK